MLKVATWNVNGIRARQAQVQEWIDARAARRRLPAGDQGDARPAAGWLCELEGYWCYWHGGKGYSGVALHVRKAAFAERPRFTHPDVRLRDAHRDGAAAGDVTVASIYVPNGGKDFAAKMRFLEALDALRRRARSAQAQPLVLCGDLNVARTDDRRASEGAQAAHRSASAGRARAARADPRPRPRRRRPHARSRQRRAVHLVGAVAQHARSATSAGASTTCSPAQRSPRARSSLRGAARVRHERPRPGRGGVRRRPARGQRSGRAGAARARAARPASAVLSAEPAAGAACPLALSSVQVERAEAVDHAVRRDRNRNRNRNRTRGARGRSGVTAFTALRLRRCNGGDRQDGLRRADCARFGRTLPRGALGARALASERPRPAVLSGLLTLRDFDRLLADFGRPHPQGVRLAKHEAGSNGSLPVGRRCTRTRSTMPTAAATP